MTLNQQMDNIYEIEETIKNLYSIKSELCINLQQKNEDNINKNEDDFDENFRYAINLINELYIDLDKKMKELEP